jgi:hypothetical protein
VVEGVSLFSLTSTSNSAIPSAFSDLFVQHYQQPPTVQVSQILPYQLQTLNSSNSLNTMNAIILDVSFYTVVNISSIVQFVQRQLSTGALRRAFAAIPGMQFVSNITILSALFVEEIFFMNALYNH